MGDFIGKIQRSQAQFGNNPVSIVWNTFLKKYYERGRGEHLVKNIPDIWDYDSILYVGALPKKSAFLADFINHDFKVTVLEIYGPNVEELRKDKNIEVVKGDVRSLEKLIPDKFDLIFWWHGPEHIPRKDLNHTLKQITDKANKLAVCGCPWGKYNQGPLNNSNPYQVHLSALYPTDFLRNNFEVSTHGPIDFPRSNLLSWFRK